MPVFLYFHLQSSAFTDQNQHFHPLKGQLLAANSYAFAVSKHSYCKVCGLDYLVKSR